MKSPKKYIIISVLVNLLYFNCFLAEAQEIEVLNIEITTQDRVVPTKQCRSII